MFRTVVLEMVTSASILTVLCFTIERYLAICFPLISQKVLGGLTRALKMIMLVWFVSFLLAVPYSFTAGKREADSTPWHSMLPFFFEECSLV